MKHKLRVETEILWQPQWRRIIGLVVGKFMTQTNQHSVNPPDDVCTSLSFRLINGNSSHEDGCSLLVKRRANTGVTTHNQTSGKCGYTKSVGATRVLVLGEILNQGLLRILLGLLRVTLRSDLEVGCIRMGRSDGTHFPRIGLTDTNFSVGDMSCFFILRNSMTNEAIDLRVPW